MRRGGTISFSFPPFDGWVRRIILDCTAIFFTELILPRVFRPTFAGLTNGLR